MAIGSGTRLGSYEILSQLGKGGMGEVWRAKDQKLGREVAIKTLPEEFAKDEERLARFEREAKLLASLNHPNIATIHGLEEDNGIRFLVLELVEGDTLAERLKRGAIPVEETLKLALQMAEALEAAHASGVVHRDLKPANIKVTPEGKVKVLDFGLAKAFMSDGSDVNLSQSPTLSMAATQRGVILGTAAYMSPEQASGDTTDKRADIWSFGVVLFEMLTGRQTFDGKTVSHILADVLRAEPEWNSLPPNLHPRLRLLLERCLEKEAKDRCHDVADARVDIQKVLADPGGVIVQPVADIVQAPPRSILRWIALAVVLTAIVAGVSVWTLKPEPPSEPRPISRFSHVLPEDQQFTAIGRPLVALSPDGTKIVYVADQRLYLRPMDEMESRQLPGTSEGEVVGSPFFSPDGQWIGYFVIGELRKIAVSGGAPVKVADSAGSFGASWGTDDVIVFGQPQGIMRVSANGGPADLLVSTEEGEQAFGPQILPDGKSVLFTLATSTGPTRWDEAQIVVQPLESGERTIVVQGGSDGRYVPTGHIVYALDSDLFAVPFAAAALERTGGPVSIVEGVKRGGTGTANYSFSDRGALVYVVGTGLGPVKSVLALVDRDGVAERLNVPPANYRSPRVSPDGSQVAVYSDDDDNERSFLWVYDLSGDTSIRQLTFDGRNGHQIWTPDGEWITFTSSRDSDQPLTATTDGSIYRTRADGSGVAERLTTAEDGHFHAPESYSGDGRLSFRSFKTSTGVSTNAGVGWSNIWTLSGEHGAEPEVFIDLPESGQWGSVFSPDGNWIAYHSTESGNLEIYVQPFPPTGAKSQITYTGGVSPLWSRDGSQLFFHPVTVAPRLIAVDIETTPAVTSGSPQPLPIGILPGNRNFDIMPDGERFVVLVPVAVEETEDGQAPPDQINIILNWFEELKERVPVP